MNDRGSVSAFNCMQVLLNTDEYETYSGMTTNERLFFKQLCNQSCSSVNKALVHRLFQDCIRFKATKQHEK